MSFIFILVYLHKYDITILCTLNYYGAGSVLGYMHQVQMDFCENFEHWFCNLFKWVKKIAVIAHLVSSTLPHAPE